MRTPRHPGQLHPLNTPGFSRMVSKLLEQARDTHIPTPYQLDSASVVRLADIDAAVALWDTVQTQAGTGLEGTL